MGAGGCMSVKEQLEHQNPTNYGQEEALRRAPHAKPPFTLSQIKKAIPPHCFNRSLLRSFSYVVHDVAIISFLFYLAINYIPKLPSTTLRLGAWPLYWALQGSFLTAIWVLAHECGHHAFSDYSLVDDLVGFLLHSSLLYPYFSWKYSHRLHHSNTSNIECDEIHVPRPQSQLNWFDRYASKNLLGRFLDLFMTLTLGLPLYLACNLSGRRYDRFASHFDPYSPIYTDRQRIQIVMSDVGVLGMAYLLFRLASAYSFGWLIRVYGVPLIVSNAIVVLFSYLQHTHPALPHYDSTEWDWLRGALSTVDRHFGVLNKVLHNMTDSHVAHHLFPTIPHYHGLEATEAIKPILGEYYQFDGTPVYKAMWREAKACVFVEPDEGSKEKGVYWYRRYKCSLVDAGQKLS